MSSLFLTVPAWVAVASLLATLLLARRAWHRAAVLRRFGRPVAVDELGARHGQRVVVRGVLEGGEVVTRFGAATATIRDVHPDASASRPEALRLRVGSERVVALVGPAQVVLGQREESASGEGGASSVRRIGEGATVLVAGTVSGAGEGGYRAPVLELAARAEGGWVERPLAIAAASSGARGALVAAAIFSASSGFGMWVLSGRGPVADIVPPPRSLGAPPCAAAIRAALKRNDLGDAEQLAAACPDRRAVAEARFANGRIEEAAKEFLAARAVDDDAVPSLSEVESIVVTQPPDVVQGALKKAQRAWYRGRPDLSQQSLECFTQPPSWRPCVDANVDLATVPASFGNPVSVVTDTFTFALSLPRHRMHGRDRWDDSFGERCQTLACRAAKPASLALLAAIAADGPRAAKELALMDGFAAAIERGRAGFPPSHELGYGISTEELGAGQAFAVAATAAWLLHDEPRTNRYLNHAEAHAGNTLSQHLRLGKPSAEAGKGGNGAAAGERAVPEGDSSKWSSVDRELHGLADHEEPAAFARRLADLRYVLPLRLHALLGARPRLHPAVRAWVEGDFVPTCYDCGFFAALTGVAARREAAHIVGAKELEGRLQDVSRRLGEAFMRDGSRKMLWSLELLYNPPR